MRDKTEYKLRDGKTTTNLTTYIIDLVGSPKSLTKLLNVSRSTVAGYQKRGYPAPIYAVDIESITNGRVTAKMVCDAAKAAQAKN